MLTLKLSEILYVLLFAAMVGLGMTITRIGAVEIAFWIAAGPVAYMFIATLKSASPEPLPKARLTRR
ncbi:MAG TPA: hypothetical protein VGC41_14705 [Kofleriaceae bacterium]